MVHGRVGHYLDKEKCLNKELKEKTFYLYPLTEGSNMLSYFYFTINMPFYSRSNLYRPSNKFLSQCMCKL